MVVGTIEGTAPSSVTFTDDGDGVYTVTATGSTPQEQADNLNQFLSVGGSIELNPIENWSGNLTGTDGLMVEVISTEAETSDQIAPDSYGGTDNTSKTETTTEYTNSKMARVMELQEDLHLLPNSMHSDYCTFQFRSCLLWIIRLLWMEMPLAQKVISHELIFPYSVNVHFRCCVSRLSDLFNCCRCSLIL